MRDRPDARLVYVQFPILSLHPNAMLPAEASLEAHRQGRFWEYHDALFEREPPLGRDAVLDAGRQAGLDVRALERALDAGTHRAQVEAEMRLGESLGVTGTPTFFMNGYRLVGAQPYDAFVTAYNVLLRASRRDRSGSGAAPRAAGERGAAG
jgi:protein-disulfide isomerase